MNRRLFYLQDPLHLLHWSNKVVWKKNMKLVFGDLQRNNDSFCCIGSMKIFFGEICKAKHITIVFKDQQRSQKTWLTVFLLEPVEFQFVRFVLCLFLQPALRGVIFKLLIPRRKVFWNCLYCLQVETSVENFQAFDAHTNWFNLIVLVFSISFSLCGTS